jgi:hypothetical protein
LVFPGNESKTHAYNRLVLGGNAAAGIQGGEQEGHLLHDEALHAESKMAMLTHGSDLTWVLSIVVVVRLKGRFAFVPWCALPKKVL